jgi:hypothetical protein
VEFTKRNPRAIVNNMRLYFPPDIQAIKLETSAISLHGKRKLQERIRLILDLAILSWNLPWGHHNARRCN